MKEAIIQHLNQDVKTVSKEKQQKFYPPLDSETRSAVPTDAAALYLMRKSQTLRFWFSCGTGPIRPLKINGRLAWPVADLRKLLGGAK